MMTEDASPTDRTDRATVAALLDLSHQLGDSRRSLCILGEGNTSALLEGGRLAVKASGSILGQLQLGDLTWCHQQPLVQALDQETMTDTQMHDLLKSSQVSSEAKKPSIETVFHAWLLTLPGVGFVGHTHCLAANQILCSPRGKEFATQRLFPDEVVVCGRSSVWVPYTDPGLPLAKAIREGVQQHLQEEGLPPKLVLLQNHGIIALGATSEAVLAITLMAEKAAAIFVGAAALGGPEFMQPEHVDRIASRPDEHERQQRLHLGEPLASDRKSL